MKVVLFARVSTNIQDYDRQINELTELAKRNGWNIAASFAEKVSSDTMFNLILKNVKLYHIKRSSIWINFWSMLIILLSILSVMFAIITLASN